MAKIIWRDRKHWLCFPFSFTKYSLSDDRIFCERGLLKTSYDETQLYRITDVQMQRSFGQKIWGTGTINLASRDQAEPNIQLKNIKNCYAVKEMIVSLVEEARRRNMVREITGGIQTDGLDLTDADHDGIPDIFQN